VISERKDRNRISLKRAILYCSPPFNFYTRSLYTRTLSQGSFFSFQIVPAQKMKQAEEKGKFNRKGKINESTFVNYLFRMFCRCPV